MNTKKSRKRAANAASLPPPKKKKSGANKKSPKQSKNFFALEVALPPPNDKPPNDPNHTATVSNSTTNPNLPATREMNPKVYERNVHVHVRYYLKNIFRNYLFVS